MSKKFISALMALALSACSTISFNISSSDEPVKPTSNAMVTRVVANTSLRAWLTDEANTFNRTRTQTSSRAPAFVELDFRDAGDAVTSFSSPSNLPALWIPDTVAWTDVAAARKVSTFGGDCVSVATSPLVIATWQPIAESLGYPTRTLGWLDFSSLASDPQLWSYYSGGQFGKTLRMAHPHPGLSGAGAGTLLAVAQAASQSPRTLTDADIAQPILRASITAFESSVSQFAPNVESLAKDMRARGSGSIGAAVMYESDVAQMAAAASKSDTPIVPIYPFDGTFFATHPACVRNDAPTQQQEVAKLFRQFLTGKDTQTRAAKTGLRPILNLDTKITRAEGVDWSQPKLNFGAQNGAAIGAVQSLWLSARRGVNVVMTLDVSGSMAGDKLRSMQSAAAQFVQQMGDADQISLISFSTAPRVLMRAQSIKTARASAVNAINGLVANGNTAIWDSLGESAKLINETKSSARTNVIILLTDGQDNSSRAYQFGDALFKQAASNDTNVYTIAYGSDADNARLDELAKKASGVSYKGSEANIGKIYQEMSAVFGGNAGVGR